jgi:hypothetical protein
MYRTDDNAEEFSDEMFDEKVLRDVTRAFAELLANIFSVTHLKKENRTIDSSGLALNPFRNLELVQFFITDSVCYLSTNVIRFFGTHPFYRLLLLYSIAFYDS